MGVSVHHTEVPAIVSVNVNTMEAIRTQQGMPEETCKLVEGTSGMAECTWADGTVFKSETPNLFFHIVAKPKPKRKPKAKAKAKKKPKAKGKAKADVEEEGEESEDEGEDDAAEDEEEDDVAAPAEVPGGEAELEEPPKKKRKSKQEPIQIAS